MGVGVLVFLHKQLRTDNCLGQTSGTSKLSWFLSKTLTTLFFAHCAFIGSDLLTVCCFVLVLKDALQLERELIRTFPVKHVKFFTWKISKMWWDQVPAKEIKTKILVFQNGKWGTSVQFCCTVSSKHSSFVLRVRVEPKPEISKN